MMSQLSFLQPTALSVSEINQYLARVLAEDPLAQDVWVHGEVSNLAHPPSGHLYFTLKDATSALKCVVWKAAALRMRFPLTNGMQVEAHGAIGIYERDGIYQLYADTLRPVGEGALYAEFLRLKARLEAEGLFDPERKRPLPARPRTIGVVTSANGAALQDILNTLSARYPLAEVWLVHSAVQGAEAPGQIVAALERLNAARPDVIIVARGGGSLEDLWSFNDERVVRAIAASAVPVVSGVGHETDFTLADFAADVRAPTPTGAAVLATPDIRDLLGELENITGALHQLMQDILLEQRARLTDARHSLQSTSPVQRLQREQQTIDNLGEKMRRMAQHALDLRQAQVTNITSRLQALSPLAVLQRGYAIVTRRIDGIILRTVDQTVPGDGLHIRLASGSLDATTDQTYPPEQE